MRIEAPDRTVCQHTGEVADLSRRDTAVCDAADESEAL